MLTTVIMQVENASAAIVIAMGGTETEKADEKTFVYPDLVTSRMSPLAIYQENKLWIEKILSADSLLEERDTERPSASALFANARHMHEKPAFAPMFLEPCYDGAGRPYDALTPMMQQAFQSHADKCFGTPLDQRVAIGMEPAYFEGLYEGVNVQTLLSQLHFAGALKDQPAGVISAVLPVRNDLVIDLGIPEGWVQQRLALDAGARDITLDRLRRAFDAKWIVRDGPHRERHGNILIRTDSALANRVFWAKGHPELNVKRLVRVGTRHQTMDVLYASVPLDDALNGLVHRLGEMLAVVKEAGSDVI